MPNEAADAANVSPLARFVLDKKDREGFSFRDMDLAAARAGHVYSASAFHQLAQDKLKRPLNPRQVAAIAAGLGVPAPVIQRLDDDRWRDAVRRRDDGEPLTLEDAVRADPGLLPEAKEHLLNQIALLRRLGDSRLTVGTDSAAPTAGRIGPTREDLDDKARLIVAKARTEEPVKGERVRRSPDLR